ncbi:RNA polymerase sigma factor [Dyadobacter pollutisoli]|uniref:RNA polymerase sigma factor n=1 Tax=Dyadobacter pollutisoli TaxID=2910158 RepID=A0A9E8NH88_9BACT|nr:RNA polymerase sigma factor [Dyadobacter pollutisoli]WAC14946.1 RNA polymerase sigma factor [Dyadobacter pollutisoli]
MSYLTVYDEREVILKIVGGDERAFRSFFNQYHQLLATHIFRITKSRELTEEVVQDVFLKIWSKRECLLEINDFRSYLSAASRNQALSALKKLAEERAMILDINWTTIEDEIEGDNEVSEHPQWIDEAIDQLPNQQRTVYLLSRHENLKYHEIASRLNISRETVKTYLQLASKSITKYLQRKLFGGFLWIILLFF